MRLDHLAFVTDRLADSVVANGQDAAFVWGNEWSCLGSRQFVLSGDEIERHAQLHDGPVPGTVLSGSIINAGFHLGYWAGRNTLVVTEHSQPTIHCFRNGKHTRSLEHPAFERAVCCGSGDTLWVAGSISRRFARLDGAGRLEMEFTLESLGVGSESVSRIVACKVWNGRLYIIGDYSVKNHPRLVFSVDAETLGDLRHHVAGPLFLPREFVETEQGLALGDSWFPSLATMGLETRAPKTVFRTSLPQSPKGYLCCGGLVVVATNHEISICDRRGVVVGVCRLSGPERVVQMIAIPGGVCVLRADGAPVTLIPLEFLLSIPSADLGRGETSPCA
ncbi:hypothetical protein [Pseudodesulfovibrio pelocollis]|uniref:hypothetical protein n=1 Tax=Pseudodesulfovibrio pelocollis TaxID=3051432 RepID=UPI00255ADE71|nr:hypothetical protein [Pseudodesulfovibrio sp. SB368]